MIRTEQPKGRTYGECIIDELRSIRLYDGKFITTLRIVNKPEKMPKELATAYYTQKLRQIWKELSVSSTCVNNHFVKEFNENISC